MSLAIFNISGHTVSEADITKIKSLLEKIKNGVKHDEYDIRDKLISPGFILGSLPYIFTGFNMDIRTEIPHEGQNTLGSVYEVCKILCKRETVDISTLLCAHKAKRNINKHGLIDTIKFEDVQIALNLMGGIIDNSPIKSGKHIFYQPGGNIRDIQSVFPPLLYKYLINGKSIEMLDKLQEHLESMKRYLSKSETKKLSFSVENLGKIYEKAERQLSEKPNENGELGIIKIAERLTKNRIISIHKQIESHQSYLTNLSTLKGDILVDQIKDIVSIGDSPEKIALRAVQETAIYYA